VEGRSRAIRGEVGDGGGTNSMLCFQLERGGDMMNHCRKMKLMERDHLGSIRRKCDTAWRRRLEERQHQRGEREETSLVALTRILLGWKMKKIHSVDSVATNRL
jgi:hypothetical protein